MLYTGDSSPQNRNPRVSFWPRRNSSCQFRREFWIFSCFSTCISSVAEVDPSVISVCAVDDWLLLRHRRKCRGLLNVAYVRHPLHVKMKSVLHSVALIMYSWSLNLWVLIYYKLQQVIGSSGAAIWWPKSNKLWCFVGILSTFPIGIRLTGHLYCYSSSQSVITSQY